MHACRDFEKNGSLLSAFSKRALHSNVPSNLVPGTFFKLFRGERGGPWYGPSAPTGRHFAIRTLGYKRAFGAGTRYASLGLFLGIFGATGRDQSGTWYGTRKALHERHVWKTLILLHAWLSLGVRPCVLQRLVLCVPFSHGWWGSCGQQTQANVQGVMQQTLGGEQSEAPR